MNTTKNLNKLVSEHSIKRGGHSYFERREATIFSKGFQCQVTRTIDHQQSVVYLITKNEFGQHVTEKTLLNPDELIDFRTNWESHWKPTLPTKESVSNFLGNLMKIDPMKQSNQINNTDILRPEITSPNESDSEIDVDHDKRSKPSPKIESEQPFQGLSRVGQGENLNKSTLRKNESKLKDKADDNSREKAPSGEDSVKVNSTNEPSNFANETTNDAPNDKVNGSNEPINFLPLVNINTPVDDVEKDTSSNESSGFGKVGTLNTPVDDVEQANSTNKPSGFGIVGTIDSPVDFEKVGSSNEPSSFGKVGTLDTPMVSSSNEPSGFGKVGTNETPVDDVEKVSSSNEPSGFGKAGTLDTPMVNSSNEPSGFGKAGTLETPMVSSSNEPSGFGKVGTSDSTVDDVEKASSSNEPSGFGKVGTLDTPVDDDEQANSTNKPSGFGKVGTNDSTVDDEKVGSSNEPSGFGKAGTLDTPTVSSSNEPSGFGKAGTLDTPTVSSSNEPSGFGKVGTFDTPVDDVEKVSSSNEPSVSNQVVTIDSPVNNVQKVGNSNEPSGFGKARTLDAPVDVENVGSSNEPSGCSQWVNIDIPEDIFENVNSTNELRGFDQGVIVETPQTDSRQFAFTDTMLESFIKPLAESSNLDDRDLNNDLEFLERPFLEDPKQTDTLEGLNDQFPEEVKLLRECLDEIETEDTLENNSSSGVASGLDQVGTLDTPDSFTKVCPEASNLDGWDFNNDFDLLERPFLEDPKLEDKEETVALEDLDDQFPEEVKFLIELNKRLADLDQMFKTMKEQVDYNTKLLADLEGRNFNEGSNS